MTTYTAWDGKEYPRPVPENWYLAPDGRWWPVGYGPGPDENADDDGSVAAFTPPGPPDEFGGSTDDGAMVDGTVDSSLGDLSGTGGRSRSKEGSSTRRRALVAMLLIALLAAGAVTVFRATDDDGATAPATTAPITETTVEDTVETIPEDDAATSTTTETVPTTPPPPERGSIEDPYTIGEPIRLEYVDAASGDEKIWIVEALAPAADRTGEVLAENQFNDPPPGDSLFVLAPVRVTYESGPAPASLFDLNFKAIGPSGVVLTTFDPSCGVVPNGLDSLVELFPGGTVEGNICWVARAGDAVDLMMMLEVFLIEGETFVDLTE